MGKLLTDFNALPFWVRFGIRQIVKHILKIAQKEGIPVKDAAQDISKIILQLLLENQVKPKPPILKEKMA